MQRLNSRRLTDDRGAIAVVVCLVMVVLLGFAALSVDVGSIHAAKRRLQNAADAAALAIAQDCGRGACGSPASTATTFAVANAGARATSTPSISGNVVSVTARETVPLAFAPVLGHDSAAAAAQSRAAWGSPTGGTAILPIVFSWCSFAAQTGGGLPSGTTERTILLPKTDNSSCTGPSGNPVPGGFGWLRTDGSGCRATTSVLTPQVPSDPGRSRPSGCTTADFAAQQNKTVLLPVFDTFGASGSGAWYHVHAYAAFRITGYSFGGQYKWPNNAPCSGDDSCIRGYFTRMVILAGSEPAFTYGTGHPDLGASVVALTG